MGQPVDVKQTVAGAPGRIRFELNRTLTGQGHERFTSAAQAIGPRPAAELARRLFTSGVVTGVHLFANIVGKDKWKASGRRLVIVYVYVYNLNLHFMNNIRILVRPS